MARRSLLSLLLLALLVPLALWAGLRARERMATYSAVEALCREVDAGRWDAALAFDPGGIEPSPAGLRAAECRCRALVERDRPRECLATLEALMVDPRSGDWLPQLSLVALAVEGRQERGDLAGAAHLAQRAARRNPQEMALLHLEIVLRQQLGDEAELLADLHRQLPRAGRAEARLRLHMAVLHLRRGEWTETLELLGATAEGTPDPESWYRLKAGALAGSGRPGELREVLEQWRRAGAEPAFVEAFYAYLVSVYQLRDPQQRHPVDLLRAAVARADEIGDETLARDVTTRLVSTLVVAGRHDEALAYLDRGEERFGVDQVGSLRRDDLLRSASQHLMGHEGLVALRGRVDFEVPDRREGDTLWVTPDPGEPVDSPYQALAVPADGRLSVERGLGTWPQRWVLEDPDGELRGAGTVWPDPRAVSRVRVERRPPLPALPAHAAPEPAPAAGPSRVFVVILDGADWRFVQHGRLLGRLPVIDRMARTGYRAVLSSDPPYTAVALQSLLRPDKEGVEGFLDVVYQLGAEIEGLNFVGSNPFERLAWLLPGGGDLFTVLGSGELSTVNLLHSFGGLEAGRHGQVVGPFGAQGAARIRQVSRPLRQEEAALATELMADEGSARLLEEMAADFDAISALAEDPAYDVVVLRVASFDVLTHRNFPSAVRTGQDDGELPLLGAYRYADQRLGELWRRMSPEDVLVVMSDHGIRTALEHDPRALFLAVGGPVVPGRAEGQPELRGFGRMLAELFGVETGWPATGIEPWGRSPVEASAAER